MDSYFKKREKRGKAIEDQRVNVWYNSFVFVPASFCALYFPLLDGNLLGEIVLEAKCHTTNQLWHEQLI